MPARDLTRRAFLGVTAGSMAAACERPRLGPGAAAELDADLGQILWSGFSGADPAPSPGLAAAVARGQIGALVAIRDNVASAAQLRALADALHDAAAPSGVPILLAADQEGGRIMAVRDLTAWPAASALGAHDDAKLARAVGAALGREVAAAGLDVDLAPVLDVLVEPKNTVIGDRAFSSDPAAVTRLGGAFAAGLADAGVLACGKHFPGHGATVLDSHVSLPVSTRTPAQLAAVELAPFAALAAELPLVMSAHVALAGLGLARPATLEPAIMTDLLRDTLGFRGVLVSDDLGMTAIAAYRSPEESARLALLAGCDALLFAHRGDWLAAARAGLHNAARQDAAVRRRIREAAARIRRLKALPRPPRPRLADLDLAAHAALAARADKSGT